MTSPKIALTTLLILTGISFSPVQTNYWLSTPVQAQSNKQTSQQAQQLFQTGIQQYRSQEYDGAIASFEEALTIYQQLGDRPQESSLLTTLGLVYDALRDHQKAVEYHQQSLAIARELDDIKLEGSAIGSLGVSYLYLNQYQQALEQFERQVEISRQLKLPDGESWALGKVGEVNFALQNYDQAIDYFNQGLVIVRELGNKLRESEFLGRLGNIYRSKGEYITAIEYLEKTLVITRELNNEYGEAFLLSSIGEVYLVLGDGEKARASFEQGLPIAKATGNRGAEVANINGIGRSYYSQRDWTKAIEYLTQALELSQSYNLKASSMGIFGTLGNAYFYLGEVEKGIENLEQNLTIAIEIGDRQQQGFALSSLGVMYDSLGDYNQVIDYLQRGLKLSRQVGDSNIEGYILNNLGTANSRTGNDAEAEKYFRQAMELRESIRANLGDNDALKVSIADSRINTGVYQNLQKVLLNQDKIEAALEISERGRARAFVELIQERLSEDKASKVTSEPLNIEEIKQIAKEQNATLVEYSILETSIYTWVVKPSGEVLFKSIDLSSLDSSLTKLVKETRNSLFSRSPSRAKGKLTEAYQLLIEPIATFLPANPEERVIFIPQGQLFLIPFAALMDESGNYLIQKHTILTAPSIQVLQLTRTQREQIETLGNEDSLVVGLPRNSLVVGNPVMPVLPNSNEDLAPLPGAEDEAKAIAPLLETQAIVGQQATKEAILERMPKSRLIHLATHGLLDDIDGLGIPGALALTPDSKDSGLLTAGEILSLKLNAELVVLSACNTGNGRITGDGVIGLSRSFITAGASSVVVSLWKVPDEPTALLMPEFYEYFQETGDKAQALRQAMLATLAEYPAPKNWAAFTLMGEAD